MDVDRARSLLAGKQDPTTTLLLDLHDRLVHIEHMLHTVIEKENRIMTTQDEINALVAQLQEEESGLAAVAASLTDSAAKIQAELDGLAAQGVDVTALQAEVSNLAGVGDQVKAAADAVGALAPPEPPA